MGRWTSNSSASKGRARMKRIPPPLSKIIFISAFQLSDRKPENISGIEVELSSTSIPMAYLLSQAFESPEMRSQNEAS